MHSAVCASSGRQITQRIDRMEIVIAAIFSFLLDLFLGDPPWMPHPVVFMGKCITALERALRRVFPSTPRGELAGGAVLAAVLPLGTLLLSWAVLRLLGRLHPTLGFALELIWGWQVLAMRGLRDESQNVHRALTEGTLEQARSAVGRIVGRDTQSLTAQGVTKAAVETVAENFSDGVFAPMLYLILGGAPLALCYKAVNTMDSMIGYKNDLYLYFGRASARLDDAANYVPSRLAALLLIASAFLAGENSRDAYRIWRRDRRKHASPNSAQTESAMAGALGVELGGAAFYFGKRFDKPAIGDAAREIEPGDILRANRLLYWGGCLSLILLDGARALLILI